MKQNKWGSRSV